MRSIWLDFAQVLFLCVMDRDMVELYKHANNERGQYQAILIYMEICYMEKEPFLVEHSRCPTEGKIVPSYLIW